MTYSGSYYSSSGDTKYQKPITVELDDYVNLKIKESTNSLKRQYDDLKSQYEDRNNSIALEIKEKYGEELKQMKDNIEYLQNVIWSKDAEISKYQEILKILGSKRFIGPTIRKTYKKYNSLWESVKSTIKTK